jgi:hypothetical protein
MTITTNKMTKAKNPYGTVPWHCQSVTTHANGTYSDSSKKTRKKDGLWVGFLRKFFNYL